MIELGSKQLKYKQQIIKHSIVQLNNTINNNMSIVKNITKCTDDLISAKELLVKLKSFKLEDKKDFILNTINTAISDVFNNNVRIALEPSSSGTKLSMKYDIILYQNDVEMARNEKLMTSNGGGVLSVISMIFKILVGFLYSDNKFYMFDESLSQVSAEYRPRLSQFIRKLCEVHGFTIILVSHTDDLDSYAHNVYHFENTTPNDIPTLGIHSHNTNNSDTELVQYNLSISNFQSIVSLDIKLSGFTIIKGANNTGKSAVLRALNSLLFNTFDPKVYPRKNIKRGSECVIDFKNLSIGTQIIMNYKNQKVHYVFDDKEYIGKNLSFAKVKEKVETLGFKYINLKTTYKNFKGSLKDQTERLSLTTQYDGLYLVGSKSNETEKIFNFLFDSYEVAQSIESIKSDISDLTTEYNNVIQQTDLDKNKLAQLQLELSVINEYITICILDEFKASLSREKVLYNNIQTSTERLKFINRITLLSTKNIELDLNISKLDSLNTTDTKNIYDIISVLCQNTKEYNIINSYFGLINRCNLLTDISVVQNNKISIYDSNILEIKQNITKVDKINNLFNLMNEYNTIDSKLKLDVEALNEGYKSNNIIQCPNCVGKGLIYGK